MSSVSAGGQSNKRVIALILGIAGVLFLILGIVYLAVPAHSLPGFIGYIKNGGTGKHNLRMAGSFVIAVACSEYGLSADDAVMAATEGGARALRRRDVGHLRPGAGADLVVIGGEHWVDIPYHPGMDMIDHVVKDGVVVR